MAVVDIVGASVDCLTRGDGPRKSGAPGSSSSKAIHLTYCNDTPSCQACLDGPGNERLARRMD